MHFSVLYFDDTANSLGRTVGSSCCLRQWKPLNYEPQSPINWSPALHLARALSPHPLPRASGAFAALLWAASVKTPAVPEHLHISVIAQRSRLLTNVSSLAHKGKGTLGRHRVAGLDCLERGSAIIINNQRKVNLEVGVPTSQHPE